MNIDTSTILSVIAIAGFAVLLYTVNQRMTGIPNVICPQIFFNTTSLHPQLHLSDMDTTVSNFKTGYYNSMQDERQLVKFKGIVAKTPMDKTTKAVIAVGFSYTIIADIPDNKVLLQIGVAERDVIDLDGTLGIHTKAWSVAVAGCNNQYVCLIAENDGNIKDKLPISSNKVNSTVSKKIIFEYDPQFETIAVYINTMSAEFLTFEGVSSEYGIWPTVAVFNPTLAKTSLAAVTNLEFDVTTLHRLVYISDDSKIISNVKLRQEFSLRSHRGNLARYRGVIADIKFTNRFINELPYYFEAIVKPNLLVYELGKDGFVFEVGFTLNHLADKGKSLKEHATSWVISAGRCEKDRLSVCLKTWHDSKKVKEIEILRSSPSKTFNEHIVLGFLLDPKEGLIKFSKREPKKHLQTFENVRFGKGLYPVFGLSEHPKVSVQLRTAASIPRLSFFGYHFKSPVCQL